MKIQFTGFEKYTGECLASCGGWADSGHKPDCELGQVAAELERLQHIEKAAIAFVNADGRHDPTKKYQALKDALKGTTK